MPPGWHTVSPESCDATKTSWCFKTTIDVGVSGLTSLPGGVPSYKKVRNPDKAHTDAVAFFGTPDAIFYLGAIAELYNRLSNNVLSVNDMSLIKGVPRFAFQSNNPRSTMALLGREPGALRLPNPAPHT